MCWYINNKRDTSQAGISKTFYTTIGIIQYQNTYLQIVCGYSETKGVTQRNWVFDYVEVL